MNIVIFTDTYLPKIDGVAISVSNFMKYMVPEGHRFLIFCPSYAGTEREETVSESVKIIRFKSAPLPSYPDIKVVIPSHRRIRKALEEFRPDIIHFQTPGMLGHYAVLASHLYSIPCTGTYHTLVSEQDMYLSLYRLLRMDRILNYFRTGRKIRKNLNKIERKSVKSIKKRVILGLANMLYDQGEMIISPSQLIRKELQSYGVRKPVVTVSNGLELDKFSSEPRKFPGKAPRLLHVGRISYEKNCEVILKSFALILEKIPDAVLSIIGDGPALPSLKIEAKQLGIDSKVSFPGFIKHDDLPETYRNHDIFLTASTMETQGLVALESAASGLPLVGVDAYALPEIIVDGHNGFIAPPGDHQEIAAAAIRILTDPDLYEVFSENSISVASGHDIKACSRKLEETYKMVIDSFNRHSTVTEHG